MSYLDASAIRAFASSRHEFASQLGLVGAPTFALPGAIGQEADRLALAFFRQRADVNPFAQANLARCAGYLVYAHERYGCRHEQVCEVASLKVAKILEQLTPDVRLPQGPRQVDQRTRLGRADETAQLVRLAEIRRTTRRLLSIANIETSSDLVEIATWVEDAYHMCGVMHALRKEKEIAAAIDTTATRLAGLLDRTDQRRRRDRRRKQAADAVEHDWDGRSSCSTTLEEALS